MVAPPVIALSSASVRARYDGRKERLVGTNVAYERAVARAGGIPVVLPFGVRGRRAVAVLARADALVLTGGDDVTDPALGEPPGQGDPVRDASDAALLAAARAQGLPVLGVCRGVQLLAVRSGGALARVDGHAPPPGGPMGRHRVRLEAASWVAHRLGATVGVVPSLHRFAVADPGRLAVVARAGDGTIEAIADPARFEVGVQWHPELSGGALGRPLWRALVEAAAGSAGAAGPAGGVERAEVAGCAGAAAGPPATARPAAVAPPRERRPDGYAAAEPTEVVSR